MFRMDTQHRRARGSNSTDHIPLPLIFLLSCTWWLKRSLSAGNTTSSTQGEASAWSEDHPKPTGGRHSPLPSFPLADPKSATLQPKLPASWGWDSRGDKGVLLALSLHFPNPSLTLCTAGTLWGLLALEGLWDGSCPAPLQGSRSTEALPGL